MRKTEKCPRTCPEICPYHRQLKINAMAKQYRSSEGLRWAPHKGKMIREEEWNEDEYWEWKTALYLAAAEKCKKKELN